MSESFDINKLRTGMFYLFSMSYTNTNATNLV